QLPKRIARLHFVDRRGGHDELLADLERAIGEIVEADKLLHGGAEGLGDAPQRVHWLYHINEGLTLAFQGSDGLRPHDAVWGQAACELEGGHHPAGLRTEVTVGFECIP